MCGFVGFVGGRWQGEDRAADQVRRMAAAIAHRGPDSSGHWVEPEARVAFGHNRLAILDLSPAGAQPMASASGRFVLVYNGEVYNHLELRRELQRNWQGGSDTETLLAGFEAWGVRRTLERLVGMFAFAVWDKDKGQLLLARDRLGEKPLYYGWQGQGQERALLFGSELKGLAAHESFEGEVDRTALTGFLRYNYVPAPRSIYRGIAKLRPGYLLTVDGETLREEPYWSALEVAVRGQAEPFRGSPDEAVDALEQVLSRAVGQQMLSDVPLGAFLSGGVDSSTIVALMQAQSSRPVKSFSIGFHEEAYDEARYARAVARHLGTDHTELYVTPEQAMDVIPRLPAIYDEPFADSSQIPTFLVSQLARRHVTVSLSGDAGDELFAGYNRYMVTQSVWGRLARVPRPLRAAAARALLALSPASWNRLGALAEPVLPRAARMAVLGEKIHKGARVMASPSAATLYLGLTSQWPNPEALVIEGQEDAPRGAVSGLGDVEAMMAQDTTNYLPDDILVKVDRAAMAVSLETRVPFLDHRVVEFAWTLPLDLKIREGQSKWVLRQLLYRHVPRALIERPKMGFGVPIDSWLRGPLKDWAAGLLDETRLRAEGFLRPEPIRRAWETHQKGAANLQHQLWGVLMFQAWLDAQRR